MALVRTRNRHLVPNFWQWPVSISLTTLFRPFLSRLDSAVKTVNTSVSYNHSQVSCVSIARDANSLCDVWVGYALEGSTLSLRKCDFSRLFHTERSWHTYGFTVTFVSGRQDLPSDERAFSLTSFER